MVVRVDIRALAAWGGKQPTKRLRMSVLHCTDTHAHARTRTHTHAHARTRTHTHSHALTRTRSQPAYIYTHGFDFRFLVFWYFRFGFFVFWGPDPDYVLNIWFFGLAPLFPKT